MGGTHALSPRFSLAMVGDGEALVNERSNKDAVPPAVFSAPPEREIERKVKHDPNDLNARVDLGSDESMDASDPPAAAQPGCSDEPAPSSGFPE
jgi:hypothetical protein